MSFVAISVGVAAVGLGYSVYAGNQAAKQNAGAAGRSLLQSKATAEAADEANNKANARMPDSAAAASAAAMASKAGNGGTLLTGPSGIDPTQLSLGKQTLLGGGP